MNFTKLIRILKLLENTMALTHTFSAVVRNAEINGLRRQTSYCMVDPVQNVAKKKVGDILRKTHGVFVQELSTINTNISVIGQYENNHTKILCKCQICGNEWKATPNSLLAGRNCPKCACVTSAEKQRKSHTQFVEEMSIINPMIAVLGKYSGNKNKIECQCVDCENKWFAVPSNLLNGHGCPTCAKTQTSFVEKAILLFLQHVLSKDDVVSRDRSMIGKEIDVYIKSLHAGIEFGGWYWHKTKVDADKEKYDCCCEKGINLITIYDQFNEDRKKFGFNDTFITYSYNLGDINRRPELRNCIVNIFHLLNLNYSFTEEEE